MCGWPKIRWYNTINARLNWNEMLKHIEGKWKEMTKLIMCWYFVKHFVCQRYIVTLYKSICVELRVIFERHEDICEKKQGTSWSRCNTLQWKLQRFQIWWSRNFIAWKYIVCGKKQTKKPQYQKWNARPFLKKLLILLSYPEMSDASFTFERDRKINVFPKRFLSFIAPVLEGNEAKIIWAVLTAPQTSLYNFVSEK